MTPFWSDDHLTLHGGDCREVLASMEPESVHCVVTSPPYWGLRDYGTATWACEGKHEPMKADADWWRKSSAEIRAEIEAEPMPPPSGCPICGAPRIDRQLGLEPTPEEYVANMVAVFREIRRVLRNDGTLWLNLGDSYAAQRGGTTMPAETLAGGRGGLMKDGARVNRDRHDGYSPTRNASAIGLKHKDLVGIPWRVAFALQADGWYLRSDIIWSKPNPMPESVTDRPTKAHEYLFLLSKAPRYFFDADAVREADSGTDHARRVLTGPSLEPSGGLVGPHTGIRTVDGRNGSGRNLRSVWTIATEPYPGAHFATFPRKLVEPCIKAGTSERGVCPECGAPWERVTLGGSGTYGDRKALGYDKPANMKVGEHPGNHRGIHPPGMKHDLDAGSRVTTGWRPSCSHDATPVPAQVLDPFAGSGTTLLVAQSLGRRGVGIDLNPDYLKQALLRNAQTPLGLVG